jgi:hypothetical protein
MWRTLTPLANGGRGEGGGGGGVGRVVKYGSDCVWVAFHLPRYGDQVDTRTGSMVQLYYDNIFHLGNCKFSYSQVFFCCHEFCYTRRS